MTWKRRLTANDNDVFSIGERIEITNSEVVETFDSHGFIRDIMPATEAGTLYYIEFENPKNPGNAFLKEEDIKHSEPAPQKRR